MGQLTELGIKAIEFNKDYKNDEGYGKLKTIWLGAENGNLGNKRNGELVKRLGDEASAVDLIIVANTLMSVTRYAEAKELLLQALSWSRQSC